MTKEELRGAFRAEGFAPILQHLNESGRLEGTLNLTIGTPEETWEGIDVFAAAVLFGERLVEQRMLLLALCEVAELGVWFLSESAGHILKCYREQVMGQTPKPHPMARVSCHGCVLGEIRSLGLNPNRFDNGGGSDLDAVPEDTKWKYQTIRALGALGSLLADWARGEESNPDLVMRTAYEMAEAVARRLVAVGVTQDVAELMANRAALARFRMVISVETLGAPVMVFTKGGDA